MFYFHLPAVDQIQKLCETSAFLIVGFEGGVFSLLVRENCQLCLNPVYIFTVVCEHEGNQGSFHDFWS